MNSKFKIVARAKLRKKAQAEREAKDSERPRQLPWKKSRDGASQVFNDRVTETFKEYLINEARYHQEPFQDYWVVYIQGPGTDDIADVITRANPGDTEKDVIEQVFSLVGDERDGWTIDASFGRSVPNYIEEEIGTDEDWQPEEAEEFRQEIAELDLAPGQIHVRDIFS